MKTRLLFLIALCCTLTSSALTFKFDGITYFYTAGKSTCSVYAVPSDLEGVFTLPREVEYKSKIYEVTSIGTRAFKGCASLTGVVLHEGITKIENSAFSNCTALESIDIPGSVKSCGNNAFEECSSLARVTLDEGIETLGNEVFFACTSLESIDIPEGCISIGRAGFYLCRSLKEVHLPSTLMDISYGLFSVCTSLSEITVPAGVISIGDYAFAACDNLRNIYVDPANPYYASRDGVVFDKDLQTIITYPSGRTDATFTTPAGVVNINPTAFQGNDNLLHLVISEGVKNIYESAIAANLYLQSVSLPASLENFEGGAIVVCNEMTEIKLAEANPNYCMVDGVLFTKDKKGLVYSPAKRSNGRYDVPVSVERIYGSAFEQNSQLTALYMPPSVVSIGDFAFDECLALTEVVISPNVTVIPYAAFEACLSLEQVSLPDGVTEIGGSAFAGCPLKSIVLPAKLTKIGTYAFECDELNDVYCYAPEPPELAVYAFYDTFPTVHVPKGLADVYAEAINWRELRIVDDLEAPEGIANVALDATSAAPAVAYDLQGRRIRHATSQPRIEQGRKVKN